MCLQAGFAAEGAESGTPFNDINLLEKVCCLSFTSKTNYLACFPHVTGPKYTPQTGFALPVATGRPQLERETESTMNKRITNSVILEVRIC